MSLGRTEATHPIEIQLLPTTASADEIVMRRITDLINQVYAVAEEGLWVAGAARTTMGEIADLTRIGQFAVAGVNGKIVGCVRVRCLDGGKGEFGMLAADPDHRGAGIGRELVDFAEQKSRKDGLTAMQLELLVPRNWSHPAKECLAAWYHRMGYRVLRTSTIDETYPSLAPLLATTCDFVIYHKDLNGAGPMGRRTAR
jgi:ribosomal protein S18 acetylase RimI-like enzyme